MTSRASFLLKTSISSRTSLLRITPFCESFDLAAPRSPLFLLPSHRPAQTTISHTNSVIKTLPQPVWALCVCTPSPSDHPQLQQRTAGSTSRQKRHENFQHPQNSQLHDICNVFTIGSPTIRTPAVHSARQCVHSNPNPLFPFLAASSPSRLFADQRRRTRTELARKVERHRIALHTSRATVYSIALLDPKVESLPPSFHANFLVLTNVFYEQRYQQNGG